MSGFTHLDLFRTQQFNFQREYTIRYSELLVQRFHNSDNFLDRLSVTFLLIIIPAFGLAAIPQQYLADTRFNVFSFYWNASFGIFLIFIAFAVVSNYIAKTQQRSIFGFIFSVAILMSPILAILTVYVKNNYLMWYLELQTILLLFVFRVWIDDTLLELQAIHSKEMLVSVVLLILSIPWILAYFGNPLPPVLKAIFMPVHMGKHHGLDGVVTLLVMINFGIPTTQQITVPFLSSLIKPFSLTTVAASMYQFLDDFLNEQFTSRGIINYTDKVLALPNITDLKIASGILIIYILGKLLSNHHHK